MAVFLSPVGGAAVQFFDNSGQVLTGGLLYTYLAGTTTPAATYTNNTGVTFHTNPIILDASGRIPNGGEVWLSQNIQYKFVLKDSNNVLIGTWDNIIGINSNFLNYNVQAETQTATQGQTVFTLASITYTPGANTLSVYVNGSKQIATLNYVETDSTTVTFNAGLNVGDVVDFTAAISLSSGVTSADLVTYNEGDPGAVDQTVEARLQQYVSVKDFGAVGDGTTDDTAAIQSAINTGKEIFFPEPSVFYNITSAIDITVPFQAGLYYVFGGTGSVTLNAPAYPDWFGTGIDGSTGGAAFNKAALAGTAIKLADKIYNIRDEKLLTGVSIYGDGSNSTLNLCTSLVSTPINFNDIFLSITNNKDAPLDFHNFQVTALQANGAALANCVLVYEVDNVSFFNVRIYNTYTTVDGVGMLRVTGLSGSDSHSSNIKINNCNIESTQVAEGIGLTGVTGCIISDNKIYNPADDAIGLHGALSDTSYYNGDIVITGNTVYAGSRCVLLDGYNLNINITGNLFTDIGTVTHFMFLTQNPYTTVSVDNISKKVLLANNLFVSNATTYEAAAIGLTCGNDITISNNTISDGSQFLTAINIAPYGLKTGVQLPLTNVVINGNVINNAKNGISFSDGDDGYTPQNVTISNNVSTNILAFRIGGSATPVIADNWIFSGNNMGDNGPYSIVWTSNLTGLFVYDDGTNNWNLVTNVGNPTVFTATWLAGQKVTRVDPVVAGGFLYSGWVCTASGTPGTWIEIKTPA